MKWRQRRDPLDERESRFYTAKTPLGTIWVAYLEEGWQAWINYAGSDDDPIIGPPRSTPEAAQRDAERWLERKVAALVRYMEAT